MNSRPLRILIVENHPDTLLYLRRFLEQQGHKVRTAMNIADASETIRTDCPEVLLSDIGLPDGEGWTIMKNLPPGCRVFGIAMSGYGTDADLRKSREAGFEGHLIKPFDPEDLTALLDEAVSALDQNS